MSGGVRSRPCSTCPYRRDVPSGMWAAEEYDKLPLYDAPTPAQPVEGFACHSTPDEWCNGWALTHSNRGQEHELLALRFHGVTDLPEPAVPLFASGAEAAAHGMRDIDDPSPAACAAVARLERTIRRRTL
jgi:hypothetical protein